MGMLRAVSGWSPVASTACESCPRVEPAPASATTKMAKVARREGWRKNRRRAGMGGSEVEFKRRRGQKRTARGLLFQWEDRRVAGRAGFDEIRTAKRNCPLRTSVTFCRQMARLTPFRLPVFLFMLAA